MNPGGAAYALPTDIHDAETLIRTTKAGFHLNNAQNRLKHQAFRPPPGHGVVSVIRQLMGDDFCKNKSVEICQGTPGEYAGLTALTAAEIRRAASLVIDHPADFVGHAHIDHQLPPIPKDQPPPEDLLPQYDERCKKLAAVATFYKDPAPGTLGWAGPPLKLASLVSERP
jgi:hypothetical protein